MQNGGAILTGGALYGGDHLRAGELARLIRPCVGLTAAQSAATVKYYDSVLSALKSEHPRMKADTARKKALTAASRYAEKSHRHLYGGWQVFCR